MVWRTKYLEGILLKRRVQLTGISSPRSIGSELYTCFEAPTTSLSPKSSRPHHSDDSWKELLEEITTPILFKDVLLRTLPWDGLAAYPLNRHQLKEDIPVMVYHDTTYYLRPNYAALLHEPPSGVREPSTWYSQLFSRPDEQEPPEPFFYANPTGDFFLPIGYLVERICTDAKRQDRLTNYVWALNISTDPVSLWLVFDYETCDADGEASNVELSNIYRNRHNEVHEYLYTYDDAPLEGYLHLGGAWDVLKVFEDVERDWEPEQVKELDGVERRLLGPSLRAYALHMPPEYSPGFRKGNVEESSP
ncbi:MAG: hypothetical protein Q9170_005959 [Blastenia crenularia]